MTGSLILFSNLRNRRSPSILILIIWKIFSGIAWNFSVDSLYMIGSLDSLNSDCRSFSNLKTLTGSRPKKSPSVTNHGLALWAERKSSVYILDSRSVQLFWIAWVEMGSFDSLNLRKTSDCRSFSDFKTLTGCRSFSHSVEGFAHGEN